MSHPASGLAKQTTFWVHLNYSYHSWRQMMSLPIRSQPLRKLPLVWHWFCLTAEKSAFLLLFFPICVPVCVHSPALCVCIWNESPALDVGVTPAHLEAVLESLLHVTTPGLMDSQSLTAASASIDQAKHCAVQEQKEKHGCSHYVIFSDVRSFESFDLQLWTQTSHKDSLKAPFCLQIAAFVPTIADMDLWHHF